MLFPVCGGQCAMAEDWRTKTDLAIEIELRLR